MPVMKTHTTAATMSVRFEITMLPPSMSTQRFVEFEEVAGDRAAMEFGCSENSLAIMSDTDVAS